MYHVDEYGNVSRNGKQLKPFKVGKDRKYLKVRLYENGKGRDHSIHRLVAEKFIPNPKGLPHVNHKDENTFNNHYTNLEWCTAQYNKEFSSSKNFVFISPSGIETEVFNLSKFCKDNGLSNGCMYHVMSGKYKHHKGWSMPSYRDPSDGACSLHGLPNEVAL